MIFMSANLLVRTNWTFEALLIFAICQKRREWGLFQLKADGAYVALRAHVDLEMLLVKMGCRKP